MIEPGYVRLMARYDIWKNRNALLWSNGLTMPRATGVQDTPMTRMWS